MTTIVRLSCVLKPIDVVEIILIELYKTAGVRDDYVKAKKTNKLVFEAFCYSFAICPQLSSLGLLHAGI